MDFVLILSILPQPLHLLSRHKRHQLLKDHQLKIAKTRFFAPGETTWSEVAKRVANHVSGNNKNKYERYYNLINECLFLPNSPTLINAGLEGQRTLSACFVRDIDDTMPDILAASTWMGMVQKFGGGTGFDLSQIRSRGTNIQSTHGKACGPIAVLKYLAATSQMITQGGVRDGANMAVMSVYHPDILSFITMKSKESKYMLEIPMKFAQQMLDTKEWNDTEAQEYIEYCRLNGLFQLFNASVAVDTPFMEVAAAYENGGDINAGLLPCGKSIPQVWRLITEQAWTSGDPGILFIDQAREHAKFHSPLPINACNPCGEQYLPSNGSCNLGSIDLSKFVLTQTDYNIVFNYEKFKKAIHDSVEFLDDVVSVNRHPIKEIEEVNTAERRIGLGVMGWSDLLLKVQIPYDSDEALDLCSKIGNFFNTEAHRKSEILALELNEFPLFSQIEGYESMTPRRNATVTTIAPTGTISLMAGCSSGIEPHFSVGYEHKGLREQGGLGYIFASSTIEDMFNEGHGSTTGEWGSIEEFEEVLRKEYKWKPANEISVEWHIHHQARWQSNIDNSISKTLNLPNSATVQDIAKSYLMAWQSGCKGSTVYRDGCKPFQVLNTKAKTNESTSNNGDRVDIRPRNEDRIHTGRRIQRKRPDIVHGVTIKVKTNDGSLYVTINRGIRDEPFELFATVGKAGGKAHAYTEGIGRLISLLLQYNVPEREIISNLRGISAGDPVGFGNGRVLSVPDGIGKALEIFLESESTEETLVKDVEEERNRYENAPIELLVDACPECGGNLIKEDGCSGGKCFACGYSRCG